MSEYKTYWSAARRRRAVVACEREVEEGLLFIRNNGVDLAPHGRGMDHRYAKLSRAKRAYDEALVRERKMVAAAIARAK